jgi:antitoxin YefM
MIQIKLANDEKRTYFCTKNVMMAVNLTEFRRNIKKYLDEVVDNFETLIINRGKDNGVVIISLKEYNSLEATQHEMSSEANMKALDKSIQQFKEGKSFEKDLLE